MYDLFTYLKGRVGERERERKNLLSIAPFPKLLGQSEARSLEFHPALPHGEQGPNQLSHLSAFSGILAKNWMESGTTGTRTGTHV